MADATKRGRTDTGQDIGSLRKSMFLNSTWRLPLLLVGCLVVLTLSSMHLSSAHALSWSGNEGLMVMARLIRQCHVGG